MGSGVKGPLPSSDQVNAWRSTSTIPYAFIVTMLNIITHTNTFTFTFNDGTVSHSVQIRIVEATIYQAYALSL